MTHPQLSCPLTSSHCVDGTVLTDDVLPQPLLQGELPPLLCSLSLLQL